MEQKCENLTMCSFFNNFKGNNEVIINGWIRLYCDNKDKSEKCKRKIIKKETGKSPAANVSPTGKLL